MTNQWLKHFFHTLRQRLSDHQLLIVMALCTGLLTGVAAYVFKRVIGFISKWLVSGMHSDGANWGFLVLPVIGIVLTGIYQRYILHAKIYHGVERLGLSIAHRQYKLHRYLMYAPLIASSLTLGFGGSAGSEGPIAYTGAAIGSNVAQRFGVRPELMRYMIACGAAAGIAGIFKAPIGGALFSFEVLSIQLSVMAVLSVLVASIASWVAVFVLSGCSADILFAHSQSYDGHVWPFILLLGVFCGVYSFYYSRIMHLMVKYYNALKNPWIKNVLSGSVVAVCIFLFPALWGEGYGFMAKVLAGNGGDIVQYSLWDSGRTTTLVFLLMAIGILIVKPFATSSTNSGGGVAGDFAPTLFAGCIAGYFFALGANTWFGLELPIMNFALWGMAAVMAGAIQAPLMAMFLVVEMIQGYEMLLPVMAVSAISFMIVKSLGTLRNIHWFFRNKA